MPRSLALISLVVIVLLGAARAQQQPLPEYLPLSPREQAHTVGNALEVVAGFFEQFGSHVEIQGEELVNTGSSSGDEYRLARDAGSILQRANAYRLLTAGSADLGQLFDLASSGGALERRGAIWLLARVGQVGHPIPEPIRELLETYRHDPDWHIRATITALPHHGAAGSHDSHPWVRAAWWLSFEPEGAELTSLQIEFLARALIDPHPFVRTAARQATDRFEQRLPLSARARISKQIDALEEDPSPWPRKSWPDWRSSDRAIGWVYSLSSWVILPWKTTRMAGSYRDGDVGNPDRLVHRLEFLRSAADIAAISLQEMRRYPEPQMRSTAAMLVFPPGRETEETVASRVALIEDGDRGVRLAAVMSFARDTPNPYPASSTSEIRRYILGGLSSQDLQENKAAEALARGLAQRHRDAQARAWIDKNLLSEPGFPDGARQSVTNVIDALLGVIPADVAARLREASYPDAPTPPTLPAAPAALVEVFRAPDLARARLALQQLLSAGAEAAAGVLTALSTEDPRDQAARALLIEALGALPSDRARAFLAPALSAESGTRLRSLGDQLEAKIGK